MIEDAQTPDILDLLLVQGRLRELVLEVGQLLGENVGRPSQACLVQLRLGRSRQLLRNPRNRAGDRLLPRIERQQIRFTRDALLRQRIIERIVYDLLRGDDLADFCVQAILDRLHRGFHRHHAGIALGVDGELRRQLHLQLDQLRFQLLGDRVLEQQLIGLRSGLAVHLPGERVEPRGLCLDIKVDLPGVRLEIVQDRSRTCGQHRPVVLLKGQQLVLGVGQPRLCVVHVFLDKFAGERRLLTLRFLIVRGDVICERVRDRTAWYGVRPVAVIRNTLGVLGSCEIVMRPSSSSGGIGS